MSITRREFAVRAIAPPAAAWGVEPSEEARPAWSLGGEEHREEDGSWCMCRPCLARREVWRRHPLLLRAAAAAYRTKDAVRLLRAELPADSRLRDQTLALRWLLDHGVAALEAEAADEPPLSTASEASKRLADQLDAGGPLPGPRGADARTGAAYIAGVDLVVALDALVELHGCVGSCDDCYEADGLAAALEPHLDFLRGEIARPSAAVKAADKRW